MRKRDKISELYLYQRSDFMYFYNFFGFVIVFLKNVRKGIVYKRTGSTQYCLREHSLHSSFSIEAIMTK